MRNSIRTTGELLLTLALLFSITFTAFASVENDGGRTGSVTISFANEDFAGTQLSLFRVADLASDSAEPEYTLTEEFAESRASLSNLDNADALAKSLSVYVRERELSGTVGTVGRDGSVAFDDLSLGLYLILQSEALPDGRIASPCLISLPDRNEDGEWIYDVSVSPETKASEISREFTYENDQYVINLILEGTVKLPTERACADVGEVSEQTADRADSQAKTENLTVTEEEEEESDERAEDTVEQVDGEATEKDAEEPEALTAEQADGEEMDSEPSSDVGSAEDLAETVGEDTAEDTGETPQESEADSGAIETMNPTQASEDISMEVVELDADSESCRQILSCVQEQDGSDGLLSLTALSFQFSCGETALDVSDCTLTASVTSKNSAAQTYSDAAVFQEEAAPEAEAGVVFSVLTTQDQQVAELDNVLVTAQDETTPTLTVSLAADSILAVTASQTANPNFTVQYYAYVDQIDTSGTNALTVINTDNGGKGEGGKLPTNGTTPAMTNLYLSQGSDGKYTVATNKNTVVPVYSKKDYEYIKAPNLIYFNRLYENGHYQLKEVWILNDGKDSTSVDSRDWTVKLNPSSLHFTNRSESASASNDTILIDEGAVIRLVFVTTNGSYDNNATFYDYDITDRKFYKTASTAGGTYDTQDAAGSNTVYAYTKEQGINSAGNYTGSGTKLAFGNQNTGTGLDTERWNGNALNCNNSSDGKGYGGCTFGLVSKLDNGKIQYAPGVSAPNLFNEGDATGKTTFKDQTLNFTRDGDTYTLSAVSGSNAKVSNLNQFIQLKKWDGTSNFYTNSFWPMDTASTFGKSGHDLKFGSSILVNKRQYFGVSSSGQAFPTSDENQLSGVDMDHNSYFGMQYSVKFELTEDYIGPLEYYFFGDDDMWVFLDGELVCDIGGVHSSVGEYVNLWDYIKKGTSGEHTLSFYYTERGASGSTCYMRFTLPSVSSLTPEQNTGTLRVEKEVAGSSTGDKEFSFGIRFTDAEGNYLKDDYSYTRYGSAGNEIKTDVIIYNGGTFQLKDGEYIIVKYLPVGAKYYVTEVDPDPDVYLTTVSINSGEATVGREAEGIIHKTKQDAVLFVNRTFNELPSSGGTGNSIFYAVGLLLVLGAAVPLILRYQRRRS